MVLQYAYRGKDDAHLRKLFSPRGMWGEQRDSEEDRCKPVGVDPEQSSPALQARQGPPLEE